MATTKGQRIGLWVIAGAMMVGTIGGFIAMMVAPGNEAREQAELQEAQEKWQADQKEVTTKREAQSTEYYEQFSQYSSRVAEFSSEGIDELKTEDLKVGDGEKVTDTTELGVFYIGWNPSGEVFDQSIEEETLKTALAIDGPANAAVIEGWKKGLVGMKIGGVRELTIPSAQAYGEAGSGDKIPADTPLKFVVMAVPAIPDAETPQIVKDYYKRMYGVDF